VLDLVGLEVDFECGAAGTSAVDAVLGSEYVLAALL